MSKYYYPRFRNRLFTACLIIVRWRTFFARASSSGVNVKPINVNWCILVYLMSSVVAYQFPVRCVSRDRYFALVRAEVSVLTRVGNVIRKNICGVWCLNIHINTDVICGARVRGWTDDVHFLGSTYIGGIESKMVKNCQIFTNRCSVVHRLGCPKK